MKVYIEISSKKFNFKTTNDNVSDISTVFDPVATAIGILQTAEEEIIRQDDSQELV